MGSSEPLSWPNGFVDLGNIDLLVQEGFYSNRTDFIRTAIRNQLDRQKDAVKQSVARRHLDLGLATILAMIWRPCAPPASITLMKSSAM